MLRYLLAALLAAMAFQAPAAAQPSGPARFTVTVEGAGPDVILIPGLATPRAVWDRARAALGGRYRLHLIQLNGFGGTPAGPNAEGGVVAGTVEELSRYIAAAGLTRPAVIGHSMGGFIGLTLARDHPGQVDRLMIVDALPFFSTLLDPQATAAGIEPRAAQIRDMLRAPQRPEGEPTQAQADAAAAGMSRAPEGRMLVARWARAADPRVVGQAVYEIMTDDRRADLAAIRTPIHLLFAFDPAALSEERARAIYEHAYRAAPRVRLVAVGPSQHFIMLDQPERFDALLSDFLGAETDELTISVTE
ncbi:MAG TPA: alpha/beta hydrolase [Allosphingosinicella sp.]|nr:alpha/beta hydrolase [Allosphingosinicella sp.]